MRLTSVAPGAVGFGKTLVSCVAGASQACRRRVAGVSQAGVRRVTVSAEFPLHCQQIQTYAGFDERRRRGVDGLLLRA
jgi:hypothetical protein